MNSYQNELLETIDRLTTKHLTPFASKETKSEGVYLIFLSALAIGLTSGYLTFKSATVGDQEITATDPSYLIFAVSLVTLYYLVSYYIDLLGDWHAKEFHEFEEIEDYLKKELEKEQEYSKELDKQIDEKSELREKMRAALQIGEDFAPIPTIGVVVDSDKSFDEVLAEKRKSMSDLEDYSRRLQQYGNYLDNDGFDELAQKVRNRQNFDELVLAIQKWAKKSKTVYQMNRIRFFMDVAFPGCIWIVSCFFQIKYALR